MSHFPSVSHYPNESFVPMQRVVSLLIALLFISLSSAEAQPAQPPALQNRAVSIVGSAGGPAGGYTIGLEHLFVRTPTTQLGARIGGAYADNVVWDGTSTSLTAGATYIRRIGHIGEQPLSLDTSLGFTRVHSELDPGGSGITSTTQYLPYVAEALRFESKGGRWSFRLGGVFFWDEGEPLLLPQIGLGFGL